MKKKKYFFVTFGLPPAELFSAPLPILTIINMRPKRALKGRPFLVNWDWNTPQSAIHYRFCLSTRCFSLHTDFYGITASSVKGKLGYILTQVVAIYRDCGSGESLRRFVLSCFLVLNLGFGSWYIMIRVKLGFCFSFASLRVFFGALHYTEEVYFFSLFLPPKSAL